MAHTHAMTHDSDANDLFGFWLYILSDCILFSAIFAAYAVLYKNNYGGATIKELINIPYVFGETMALLLSSFTYGMSILNLYKDKLKGVMFWLSLTFLLGLTFIGMEINEFVNLCREGHSWQASAALSAFFTLVGTHGLHVTVGLFTMLVLMLQLSLFGTTSFMKRRLT